MPRHKHFQNPPITEAILDIRVELPKEAVLELLKSTQEQSNYPLEEVKSTWEASFKLKPGEAAVLNEVNTAQGYMFYTQDKMRIFQSLLTGFTYNQLEKYKSWSDFYNEAMRLWKVYSSIVKPNIITRIGLRYINKINVPLPIKNISEYVKTVPTLSEDFPHKKTNYFMRVEMSNTENENKAIITNIIDETKAKSTLPIILDIDVYREGIVADEKEMENVILSLRDYKNTLFIENLTEQTIDLIK